MKTIVCFGDSNTWGYDPRTKERYGRDIRWTGRLQRLLGDEYLIIEEGLNGRTTVWDDPIEEGRCGKQYLDPCLQSHRPIDLVILMLGTNDLKKRFDVSAEDISKGLELLVQKIRKSESGRGGDAPEILLMAPAVIRETGPFSQMFAGGEEKSKEFSWRYKEMAAIHGCRFFDTSEVMEVSDVDGIHFEPDAHEALARTLYREILSIFSTICH